MIKITDISIPLEVIFKNNTFILLNVREAKEYENGKVTANIIGYRYEVVDTETFEKFTVKVLGTATVISQENIDNAPKKIKVNFVNAFAKPYRTSSGFYELSIRADSISIVTN